MSYKRTAQQTPTPLTKPIKAHNPKNIETVRFLALKTGQQEKDTQAVNFIGRQAMSHNIRAQQTPSVSINPQPVKKTASGIPSFDTLPDSAFIREAQLVQSPKRPEYPAPLPFSGPTLWRKVKAGTFPKPLKLSERITAWKVGDVRSWIKTQALAG